MLKQYLTLGNLKRVRFCNEVELSVIEVDKLKQYLTKDTNEVLDLALRLKKRGLVRRTPSVVLLAASFVWGTNKEASVNAFCPLVETGWDLFRFFAEYRKLSRKKSCPRSVRRAISRWYTEHPALALQLVKYPRGYGWTHKDLLRVAHPRVLDSCMNRDLVRWVFTQETGVDPLLDTYLAFQNPKANALEVCKKVEDMIVVPLEIVPKHLRDKRFWEHQIKRTPTGVLIQNLGTITACGAVNHLGEPVASLLCDDGVLVRSKIHPVQVYEAWDKYGNGEGWEAAPFLLTALEHAFHVTAEARLPAPKNRTLVVVDCYPGQPRVTAAALLSAIARKWEAFTVIGHDRKGMKMLNLGNKPSLTRAIHECCDLTGGMDLTLPLRFAKRDYANILILTDNKSVRGWEVLSRTLRDYGRVRVAVLMLTRPKPVVEYPKDPKCLLAAGLDAGAFDTIVHFFDGELD